MKLTQIISNILLKDRFLAKRLGGTPHAVVEEIVEATVAELGREDLVDCELEKIVDPLDDCWERCESCEAIVHAGDEGLQHDEDGHAFCGGCVREMEPATEGST